MTNSEERMNLEKEQERVWRILDSMSVEEFDDMLERCGMKEESEVLYERD